MSARTQSNLAGVIGAVGLSMVLLTAIWAFWPEAKPPKTVANRSRPPQPTLQQPPQHDANATTYLQFWLEDQAGAYAKQLETATGESRRALEALLRQTQADLVELKARSGMPVAQPARRDGDRLIRVHTRED
jgi:hypothetical protein